LTAEDRDHRDPLAAPHLGAAPGRIGHIRLTGPIGRSYRLSSLLALAGLAAADALIASWDSKVHFNFWRPITAIREGDHDGNARTLGDATWTSLIPSPPYPDHTSAARECQTAAPGRAGTALRRAARAGAGAPGRLPAARVNTFARFCGSLMRDLTSVISVVVRPVTRSASLLRDQSEDLLRASSEKEAMPCGYDSSGS
jgi:hypothetical protein